MCFIRMKIFDSELQVMEILWQQGRLPASEIAKLLEAEVGWNKNTTYTVIKKLIAKGAIERQDPKFMCLPLVPKEDIQKQEVIELHNKFFQGTADLFLSAFVGSKKLSESEIAKMRKLIDTLDGGDET